MYPRVVDKTLFYLFSTNRIKFKSRRIMTKDNATNIETCKFNAARLAVDDNIKNDCVVGIGSGTTMVYVLERIKQRCKENGISVQCIPTSLQSKQLIHDHNLSIADLDQFFEIDVAIDGADEVDTNFVAIKGGGACLTQEKIVASAAKKFVVVADYRKDSTFLGQNWTQGIPIEVIPFACNTVRHKIATLFSSDINDIRIRQGERKAGPVITDNGNLVVDWIFDTHLTGSYMPDDWKDLADRLKLIPGIVETGVFSRMIREVYFGQPDGTVVKKVC